MPTKRELEDENADMRETLEKVYDSVGEVLGLEDDDEDDQDDD